MQPGNEAVRDEDAHPMQPGNEAVWDAHPMQPGNEAVRDEDAHPMQPGNEAVQDEDAHSMQPGNEVNYTYLTMQRTFLASVGLKIPTIILKSTSCIRCRAASRLAVSAKLSETAILSTPIDGLPTSLWYVCRKPSPAW